MARSRRPARCSTVIADTRRRSISRCATCSTQHDSRILDRLAATAPIEVVVETARDAGGGWRTFVSQHPGARLVDLGRTGPARDPGNGADGAGGGPRARLGVAAVTASVNAHDIGAVLDGDLATRWHSPSQAGGESVTADLGVETSVSVVELCLGAYPGTVSARARRRGFRGRQRVVAGLYWRDRARTYDAALLSPREVPVTLPIHRDHVRFILLRQTAADSHGWSIVELRVLR